MHNGHNLNEFYVTVERWTDKSSLFEGNIYHVYLYLEAWEQQLQLTFIAHVWVLYE